MINLFGRGFSKIFRETRERHERIRVELSSKLSEISPELESNSFALAEGSYKFNAVELACLLSSRFSNYLEHEALRIAYKNERRVVETKDIIQAYKELFVKC